MMAHIIADPIAAIVQGGKRITAVSNVLSRIAQCIAIKPAVTLPICNNSRVERIASPCGMLAEHPTEHSACDREIGRAEKHPRNANCRVSGEPGEDANR